MRRLTAFIAAALLTAPVFASSSKVGTSGAQFLKIGAGARPTSMGDAYAAIGGDVNSAYYNPAGLAQVQKAQLMAMHTQWFQGLDYNYGAFALPASFGTFAITAATLQTDEIQRRGADESYQGTFNDVDAAYGLSFGTDITDSIFFGVTGRYVKSQIDSTSANAWAGDVGLMYAHPESDFSYGLAARHIGSKLKFQDEGDPLPTVVDGGVAGRFFDRRLMVSLDVLAPRDNTVQMGGGAEWSGGREEGLRYALRAGYHSLGTDASGASGLTVGGGLGFRRLDFDVAWVPYGDLGNAFRYAINFKF